MKIYPYALASAAVLGTAAVLVGSGVSAQPVQVTAEQLTINQRISQAAVRRSNSALNYLAPVRTAATDAANTGRDGVTPLNRVAGAGEGWPTAAIANAAVTQAKIANGAVGNAQLTHPIWTVVANGTTATVVHTNANVQVARTAGQVAGVYTVTYPVNVTGCTFAATLQGAAADADGAGFITVGPVPGNANAMNVTTWSTAPALANRTFHLTAHC
jgi:hypothetical protein